MKRLSILLIALAIIAVGGGAWIFIQTYHPRPKTVVPTNSTQNTNAVVVLPSMITYQGVDGKNALVLLKESHQVLESNGLVKMIDGRPSTKAIGWMLYVNGALATTGAKDVLTKSTDTIEWRFEPYQL